MPKPGIRRTVMMTGDNERIATSNGAPIAWEITDVTIAAADLAERALLRGVANALQRRIAANYRFVPGFNSALIAFGAAGALPPASAALLHNLSTLGVSLKSMTDLPEE